MKWVYERKNGKNGFYVYAVEPIKRGEELLAVYAENLHNREMMMAYGFFDPKNEVHTPITLRVELYQNDPLLQYKKYWFRDGDPQYGGYVMFPVGDFESDAIKDTLAILRVASFNEPQYGNYLKEANIKWDKPRKN